MPRKPKKLTRAQRAAAIEYALCEADWWERPVKTIPCDARGVLTLVRGDRRTRDLVEVVNEAVEKLAPIDAVYNLLEVAALLREGWNPGDPVELRRKPTKLTRARPRTR